MGLRYSKTKVISTCPDSRVPISAYLALSGRKSRCSFIWERGHWVVWQVSRLATDQHKVHQHFSNILKNSTFPLMQTIFTNVMLCNTRYYGYDMVQLTSHINSHFVQCFPFERGYSRILEIKFATHFNCDGCRHLGWIAKREKHH